MTFVQALRTTLIDKLIDFRGRAPRSEYWWFIAFQTFVAGIIPMVIIVALGDTFTDFDDANTPMGDALYIGFDLLYFAILFPYVAVSIRRFHDIDLSGWWFIALFLIWFPIDFGVEIETLLYLPLIAPVVALLLCVRKGTDGPNRFGLDPLRHTEPEIFE